MLLSRSKRAGLSYLQVKHPLRTLLCDLRVRLGFSWEVMSSIMTGAVMVNNDMDQIELIKITQLEGLPRGRQDLEVI